MVTATGSSVLGDASRGQPSMRSDTGGFGANECKRCRVAAPNRRATLVSSQDWARQSVGGKVGGGSRKGKLGLSNVNY